MTAGVKSPLDHDDVAIVVEAPPATPIAAVATPDATNATASYRYSSMSALVASGNNRSSTASRVSDSGDGVVRSSFVDRDIQAVARLKGADAEQHTDYRGRIRIWPGLLAIAVVLSAATVLMAHYGKQTHDASVVRAQAFERAQFIKKQIAGGRPKDGSVPGTTDDIISDDGEIGNPKKYPPSQCEMPNYLSKDGHIVAVYGTKEVPLTIKGINWFGMETGQAIPLGLWDNSENGTTAYEIALFLAANKFNAVRLPLMVTWLLTNKVPNGAIMNKQTNRAVSVKDYLSLLQSIVKVLQFRNIGVLLSMHTLTVDDNGSLWYNGDVTEADFLKSIDVLTSTLCADNEYWNVMGIDLKNEPYKGTWGDNSARDFRAGAKRIADRMLQGCPQWLGFVEGINDQHALTIDGQTFEYYDWYGGGLHGAKIKRLEFSVPHKVVWAPHYYTPAVFPQYYLYGGGTTGKQNVIHKFVELDDATLRRRINVTMDDMFGFLASTTGPALLLGEFGGLYDEDIHPQKTTKRCTDFTIEIIKQKGWAGGFVWSLNPESEYQYNPADTRGRFFEGVVQRDWLHVNPAFLKGLEAMDDMENLRPFPCFRIDPTAANVATKVAATPTS